MYFYYSVLRRVMNDDDDDDEYNAKRGQHQQMINTHGHCAWISDESIGTNDSSDEL